MGTGAFLKGRRALAWRVLAALALALSGFCAFAATGDRVALLIGNGAYSAAPIRHAASDAQDLGAALRQLGFKTIVRANASRQDMIEAIRQFDTAMDGAEAALFFYAGHAMQHKERNFLLPVDAQMQSEEDVTFYGVEVAQVLNRMARARTSFNFLVLDACRDRPFGNAVTVSSVGLARMKAPPGTLIAFAAAPGAVAAEDSGPKGTYTKHLLRHIAVPSMPAEVAFKLVREDVERETQMRQSPWDASSLKGRFFFNTAAPVARADSGTPIEKAVSRLQELATGEEIAAGVKGIAELAKERLESLFRPQPAPEAQAPEAELPPTAVPKPKEHGKGTEVAPGIREIVFADGAIYRGSMRGDTMHGKGEYISKSFRYRGDFEDDQPHGRGAYQFVSGDRYEGEVTAGVISGRGSYAFASGDRFDGTFSQGKPDGTGTYFFANGDRYEGEVSAGKPQGRGLYFTRGGDRIEAPFVAGRAEGRGVYLFANGDRFEGDFQAGSLTGKGVYAYANGIRYEGDMADGRPRGTGVLFLADGMRFEGTFEDGLVKAKGELVRSDGSRVPAEIGDGAVRLAGASGPALELAGQRRVPSDMAGGAGRPAEPSRWSGNL